MLTGLKVPSWNEEMSFEPKVWFSDNVPKYGREGTKLSECVKGRSQKKSSRLQSLLSIVILKVAVDFMLLQKIYNKIS
jgi:hypothetical protein